MTSVNATNFRKNLFEYLNSALDYNDIIQVSTKNGNAIVMSEEEYNSLTEALYLLSHPGTRQEILSGMATPLSDCAPLEEVDW